MDCNDYGKQHTEERQLWRHRLPNGATHHHYHRHGRASVHNAAEAIACLLPTSNHGRTNIIFLQPAAVRFNASYRANSSDASIDGNSNGAIQQLLEPSCNDPIQHSIRCSPADAVCASVPTLDHRHHVSAHE